MVWSSVFATIGIFFAGAWFAGDQARQWASADPPTYTDDEIGIATIASYVLYALGGLLVLLFLFMRKRIALAMGCVNMLNSYQSNGAYIRRSYIELA